MSADLIRFAAIVLLLVTASACGLVTIDRGSDDVPEDPPVESPVQPDPDPTPEPEPTPTIEPDDPPPPTPIPSGSFLLADGIRIRQVVLWDVALPAEYATTQFVLYHRAEGRTWRRIGTLPVTARIIADPSDPQILYIGDHPPCLRDEDPFPFYRSFDGGRSWEAVPDVTNIRPILVWPENPEVLIGSRCGLAISRDRGETWKIHVPESGFDLIRLTATQVGLYGLFTDRNEVNILRRISLEDLEQPEFQDPLLSFWGPGAVSATRERLLVAEVTGVHYSDDGGRHWSHTQQGLENVVTSVNPMEEAIPQRELEAGVGLTVIRPHPADPNRVFLGSVRGLYLSENGGQSWGRVPEVEEHHVQDLAFTMNGTVLYVTTPEGVLIVHNP